MAIYAGLDVSDKATHVCVVDAEGAVLRRDVVASDPDALARWLDRHCSGLVRVVLETGPLSHSSTMASWNAMFGRVHLCAVCQQCAFGTGQQERRPRRRGAGAARPGRAGSSVST